MTTAAYINRIAVAVPPHDVHQAFLHLTETLFRKDSGSLSLFQRMAIRSGIEHRYSVLPLMPDWKTGPMLDAEGLYTRGKFANTAARMRVFEGRAPELAVATIDQLGIREEERRRITHLVVTSCTGFSAPGLDLEVLERCGLPPSVERTMVGFMGCYAAINALKLARHIVRSEPTARVLVLNLELCTLHLQETLEHRAAPVLPAVRRRLRRLAGDGGAEGHRARQFPRGAGAGQPRADGLEYPRPRIRHGAVGQGAARHPRCAAHRRASRSSARRQ